MQQIPVTLITELLMTNANSQQNAASLGLSAPEYHDGRTRRIHVSFIGPQGIVRCGRIEFNSAKAHARFAYESDYNGPPLDPVNLPLNGQLGAAQQRRSFRVNPAHNPDCLHRVFLDYMPGPWGWNVLNAEFPYLKGLKAVEKLHWLGTRTVGSLSFHVNDRLNEEQINGAVLLEEVRRRSVDLAVGRLNRVGSLEMLAGHGETPRWILEGLAAFGGARPKCTFRDRRGGQWIAKFNIEGDPYNCARVEHATALLAQSAGINAVHTRCVKVSGANDILFVKRYDRNAEHALHKASVFSLLPQGKVKHHSGGDYAQIFDVLSKVCPPDKSHLKEMLLRMLFNIAVNNTDDHLKNFEVILSGPNASFELSPAFDVMIDPYPSPRSTKVFGLQKPDLSDATLEKVSVSLNFSLSELRMLRQKIINAVMQWRDVFKEAGVSDKDCKRLSRIMDRPQGL